MFFLHCLCDFVYDNENADEACDFREGVPGVGIGCEGGVGFYGVDGVGMVAWGEG